MPRFCDKRFGLISILQVRDEVLNGHRLHLGMLEQRRRALAQRMAAEHPSMAAARAHLAGMCPQLRDMLLLLLDHPDCSEILNEIVAALTGMEKLGYNNKVDSMQSSKTVNTAPARHAEVGSSTFWHNRNTPNVYGSSVRARAQL